MDILLLFQINVIQFFTGAICLSQPDGFVPVAIARKIYLMLQGVVIFVGANYEDIPCPPFGAAGWLIPGGGGVVLCALWVVAHDSGFDSVKKLGSNTNVKCSIPEAVLIRLIVVQYAATNSS